MGRQRLAISPTKLLQWPLRRSRSTQSGSLHCDGARYYAGAVGTGNVDGLRVHDISSESERGRGISSQLQRESIAITGAGGAIAAHSQTVARDHDVQEYALV